MGDLIKTHSHDLIFQPTETLAARVLHEQQRSDAFEERLEDVQGKYESSRRWSFGFGGAAIALVFAAGLIWLMADSQMADANERVETAETRTAKLSTDLQIEKEITALQREDLNNLKEYERIARDYDKVRHVHLYTIDWYKDRLGVVSELPPKVQEALAYDSKIKVRLGKIQQELETDSKNLTDSVSVIENYVKTRLEEPVPGPPCFPNVIFETSGKKC